MRGQSFGDEGFKRTAEFLVHEAFQFRRLHFRHPAERPTVACVVCSRVSLCVCCCRAKKYRGDWHRGCGSHRDPISGKGSSDACCGLASGRDVANGTRGKSPASVEPLRPAAAEQNPRKSRSGVLSWQPTLCHHLRLLLEKSFSHIVSKLPARWAHRRRPWKWGPMGSQSSRCRTRR